mgnify:CR=1 FL=1
MGMNGPEPMYCGRRPKSDNVEPSVPMASEEEQEDIEEEDEEENLDEEVNFDKPTFKRDQIWNDYAEDLDYDQ